MRRWSEVAVDAVGRRKMMKLLLLGNATGGRMEKFIVTPIGRRGVEDTINTVDMGHGGKTGRSRW